MLNYYRKDWESDFFGSEIFYLDLPRGLNEQKFPIQLQNTLPHIPFQLLETNLDTLDLVHAGTLEHLGFRLVDSRATFLTPIDLSEGKYQFANQHHEYTITYAKEADHATIFALNQQYVVENPGLISRYKNQRYFHPDDARRYFSKWIEYCLEKSETHVAVCQLAGHTVGFFIFEDRGYHEDGLPVFKGILCAIDQPHQGKKLHLALQSFLFENFGPKQFYLDNTTQISNYPIFKNHIRSNRTLHELKLTFFLKSR